MWFTRVSIANPVFAVMLTAGFVGAIYFGLLTMLTILIALVAKRLDQPYPIALVVGEPDWDEHTCTAPLARHRAGRSGRLCCIDIDDGKANAISFAVLEALEPAVERACDEAKALVKAAVARNGLPIRSRTWRGPSPVCTHVSAVTPSARSSGFMIRCAWFFGSSATKT